MRVFSDMLKVAAKLWGQGGGKYCVPELLGSG